MSKIISFRAENFKKLSVVEITPDGNVITLTGENGAGKSSILDAIQSTVEGGKSVPAEPIRRGEDAGQITVKFGSLTVVRRFTPSGSTLRVTDDGGRKFNTPQAILDEFIGNLAFDPLAFSRLRAAEQWEQLRELVGLDFKQIDADRTKAYDDRTVINREILRLQTLLKEIPPSVDDAADAEVSTAAVLAEISKATQHNAEINSAEDTKKNLKATADMALVAVNKTQSEIERMTKQLADEKTVWFNAHEAWKSAVDKFVSPARADITELNSKLVSLDSANAQARLKYDRNKMLASVKTEQNKSEGLTDELVRLDAEKRQRIADAKFPLSELSFNGEVITYRNIPFSQVSDGEKLRVSVAVGMALNPKLRVIFVRDGSLLDKSGLQTIADLAKQHDYQVWLEDARSTDPSAIEIEDGAIKL